MRILLTSTSFQDTPGKHKILLEKTGFKVDTLRGPVRENVLLPIIDQYDGLICGDDEITDKVIEKGKSGLLKIISKYGVGLDKIDLEAATNFEIPVFNTPGVNHITVAEHCIGLMLTYLKNIHLEYNITRDGKWKRLIGQEIYDKRVGIIGLGKIGKEVVKRLSVFGVEIFAFDKYLDESIIDTYKIKRSNSIESICDNSDIVSLHLPLNEETKFILNERVIDGFSSPKIIVNTSRAVLIDQKALIKGLRNNKISAYLTDVMDEEPMINDHPLRYLDNVLITPHIGSRTYQSVERQGVMAVENLIKVLNKK